MIDLERLEKANRVLKTFQPDFELVIRTNKIALQWKESWGKGRIVTKTWYVRGRGHYPTIDVPAGGTAITSISQLIRWVRHAPIIPFSTWVCWWTYPGSQFIGGRRGSCRYAKVLAALVEIGWPTEVKCVVCGEKPVGIDWWTDDSKTGPCCSMGRCDPRFKE